MNAIVSFTLRLPARVPKALRGWVLPALLLFLWWAAIRYSWTDSKLLVSVGQVWQRAVEQTVTGALWEGLRASLWRDLVGFAIGAAMGLVFGGALGLSRLLEDLVGPTFHTVKQISLFAWVPLISVWFGLGDSAKIAFLSLAAFFPIALNTFEGIRSVPREFIEVARVCKLTRLQWLTRVVLPAASPSIFTGLHLGLIYAWLATLGAEYLLVAGKGIGNTMIDGRENFWMDLVVFGMIVVGAVGFILNWIAGAVEARLLAWRGRTVAHY